MSRNNPLEAQDEIDESELTDESEAPGPLPAKQELALRAVLSHPTLKEAAFAAGISETTLWRYMRDEEFIKRLREAKRDAMGHVTTRLQQASGDAVTVLHNLMTKENAPAAARITAARTVLDYSIRVAEMEELRAEIDELKEFIRRKQEEDALDAAAREEEGEE